MPVTEIKALRILPPLAIGRFGSSAEPMDNYDLVVEQTVGFRKLVPAETLKVDPATGEVTQSVTPSQVKFRDAAGNIRPVAPFLEVWARFEENGPLQPLSRAHLQELGVDIGTVQWRVRVGNHKLFRRTGDPSDRIEADTEPFSGHEQKALRGRATNFRPDKFIPLGSVQFLRPTDAFPELRLRFTPGTGKVYGHRGGDPNIVDDVYDADVGRWDTHNDGSATLPPGTPPSTIPVQIYARNQRPGPNRGRNLGYLDDSCDGIAEVQLTVNGTPHVAFGRFTVGPPDFAPDSDHVRTVAHDIEQVLLGPEVGDPIAAETVIDLVRRALETMRLMHTPAMNEVWDRPFTDAQADYANARARHADVLMALEGLKQPPGSPDRALAVDILKLVLEMLRPYDRVTDPEANRLMPALLRGSDGRFLALTRRQRRTVEKAASDFAEPAPPPVIPPSSAEQAMRNLIESLKSNAFRHTKFELEDGRRLSDLFSDPPALLNYLRTAAVRGNVVPGLKGKPLVVPGDPDASAFVTLLSTPGHPMRSPFSQVDPGTGKPRIEVVKDWIRSLT
jgi:hypothetical protein